MAREKQEKPKDRYFIVTSAVELQVDVAGGAKEAAARAEEKARQMGIPLHDVATSGNIRVFVGREIEVQTTEPQLKIAE